MDKYCRNCQTKVDEFAGFCPTCGSTDFYYPEAGYQQPDYQQQQGYDQSYYGAQPQQQDYQPAQDAYQEQPTYDQSYYGAQPQQQDYQQQSTYNQPYYEAQPQQNGYAPYAPQNQAPMSYQQQQFPQKKKGNKGAVVAIIIVVVLLALSAIVMGAQKYFQSQGYSGDSFGKKDSDDTYFDADEYDEDADDADASGTAYTKGSVDGTVYTNEWANLKYAALEGFADGDSTLYSAAENSSTDCGMYFATIDRTELIYVCIEKLPTNMNVDEKLYLDSAVENAKKMTELNYKASSDYTKVKIAGETYTKVECSFVKSDIEFTQSMYVRKLGNYMIAISAVSTSYAENDRLVNNFTTVD